MRGHLGGDAGNGFVHRAHGTGVGQHQVIGVGGVKQADVVCIVPVPHEGQHHHRQQPRGGRGHHNAPEGAHKAGAVHIGGLFQRLGQAPIGLAQDVDIQTALQAHAGDVDQHQRQRVAQQVERLAGDGFDNAEEIKIAEVNVLRQHEHLRRHNDGEHRERKQQPAPRELQPGKGVCSQHGAQRLQNGDYGRLYKGVGQRGLVFEHQHGYMPVLHRYARGDPYGGGQAHIPGVGKRRGDVDQDRRQDQVGQADNQRIAEHVDHKTARGIGGTYLALLSPLQFLVGKHKALCQFSHSRTPPFAASTRRC